jgi:hypothetical protein
MLRAQGRVLRRSSASPVEETVSPAQAVVQTASNLGPPLLVPVPL